MTAVVAAGRRLEAAWVGPPRGADARAPVLVFLHEGLGSVSAWRDFPARLADAAGLPGLVFSRAGYGRSDPASLPRPLSYMHDEARDVLPEVLGAAGIERAILVGHSDGASIALLFAGSGLPSAASTVGLVLEAPHVFVEDVSVKSIAAAAEAYRRGDLRARLARHHGDNVDVAFWGWSRAWLDPGFRAWNIEACLPHVKAPLLVVQGEDDAYGTLAQVDSIEKNAAGPVERLVLPACGHAPHRDQPEATIEAAARFVMSLLGPKSSTST